MRTIRRHMRRSQFAPTLPVFSQNLATLSWVNNDSANITSVTDELDFQLAHFPQIDIDMLHLDDPLTDNNLDDDQSFENSSEPNSVMNPASTGRCQSLTKILWLSPSLYHLLKTRILQSCSLLTQLSQEMTVLTTFTHSTHSTLFLFFCFRNWCHHEGLGGVRHETIPTSIVHRKSFEKLDSNAMNKSPE